VFLWQLQLVGRVFWIIVAGLGLYLVVDLWVLQPAPPALIPQAVSTQTPASGQATVDAVEDPTTQAAQYRQTLASRNPFRLTTSRLTEALGSQTAKDRLLELTSTLVVVGINRGRIPEALVEDTQAKRTYFVKVGDQINGVMVQSIDHNGVSVSYEGAETLLQ
jgi:hypothetical protein